MSHDIGNVLAKYLQLRDQREAIAERHKRELEGLDSQMGVIENWFLLQLNELGAENVKTEHGTVYKSTTNTAKVADWDALLEFILASGEHALFIRGVNKTAAVEYRDEHNGTPPPGVELGQVIRANVRRT